MAGWYVLIALGVVVVIALRAYYLITREDDE